MGVKVNKDFSSIFSTLLPGADARLAPPEGFGVLDGLEFKVALGSTWKENLTELSGGQRSLVALSLILAMLLFKPAPIYILDEVDAALDLSHTQNIGQMLRTHFKHSQFVVVSLKDGMFTTSTVTWTAQLQDGKGQAQKSQEKEKVKDKKQRQILKKKKTALMFVCPYTVFLHYFLFTPHFVISLLNQITFYIYIINAVVPLVFLLF
ncbi:structural maintenance of chromosomes protein 2-like [Denticeps clupeoides]|uniref:structural maintenance of chromosomes protein 2-like n=1 Tax=Denticeps clupeoides TaxID=299321 RepID=UPI0010A2C087|nr:structural maintenance of chromosomes protein 2-like [Denticeps clupeoides]